MPAFSLVICYKKPWRGVMFVSLDASQLAPLRHSSPRERQSIRHTEHSVLSLAFPIPGAGGF